jgi:hypothetical protein
MTPATDENRVENREKPEAPAPNALEVVLEHVRADAERDPDKYARDAIVSKGGE